MSYTGIPNFDDPMAKIRERIHWQSGARIVDILYGAKNPDGSPKSPEDGDGHGHLIAIEIDGVFQVISWRHPASEGGYNEYPGALQVGGHPGFQNAQERGDRDDIPLKDLEYDIRRKQGILNEARQLMSAKRYSISHASALLDRFAIIFDMNTPVEQKLKQEHARLVQRNEENARRFAKQDENAAKKQELIAQTQSIQNSTDWGSTSRRMAELMDEWKRIGYAGPENDNLWTSFQNARQVFYDRRSKHNAERDDFRKAAAHKKKELISEAQSYVRSCDYSREAAARMKAMSDAWKTAGFCGKDEGDQLWAQFREAQDTYWEGKRAAGAQKHWKWAKQTQEAIARRKQSISKIQQNTANLHDRLATTENPAKQDQIMGWIEEDAEKIAELQREIDRMEQELAE